mmetsp:Transcript_30114/g.55160  ORF Transcript_30114/g.55160 Transcript_30114/m.55160 type:complete len:276 (+) Transcript_30114:1942-2769(+)
MTCGSITSCCTTCAETCSVASGRTRSLPAAFCTDCMGSLSEGLGGASTSTLSTITTSSSAGATTTGVAPGRAFAEEVAEEVAAAAAAAFGVAWMNSSAVVMAIGLAMSSASTASPATAAAVPGDDWPLPGDIDWPPLPPVWGNRREPITEPMTRAGADGDAILEPALEEGASREPVEPAAEPGVPAVLILLPTLTAALAPAAASPPPARSDLVVPVLVAGEEGAARGAVAALLALRLGPARANVPAIKGLAVDQPGRRAPRGADIRPSAPAGAAS